MKKLKYSGLIPINVLRLRVQTSFSFKVWAFDSDVPDLRRLVLDEPNITANLSCIYLTNMKHALMQMQYKCAIIYETPSA